MKYLLLACTLICFGGALSAQSAFEDDYTKEFTYGIGINTNGGFPSSLFFRYGRIKNARANETFGIEIAQLRHPKEQRVNSIYSGGLPFIFGKQTDVFCFRPQYGREGILFRKAAQEGVQVNVVVAGGPTLALLKPYMILYNFSSDPRSTLFVREVPYDPLTQEFTRIFGRGNFFSGWDRTSLALGFNVKLGLSFEVSAFKKVLTGIEAGFTYEYFDRTIEILNDTNGVENFRSFTAAYLTFFLGHRK